MLEVVAFKCETLQSHHADAGSVTEQEGFFQFFIVLQGHADSAAVDNFPEAGVQIVFTFPITTSVANWCIFWGGNESTRGPVCPGLL